MQAESRNDVRVYRVGAHLLVVLGIFASFFVALGIGIVVKKQDWSVLGLCVAVLTVIFALQLLLRLEIGATGFKYRNISGSREVAFGDVGRAYFDVTHSKFAPQGAAGFWVERRDGTRVKINLRTLPVEGAAVLFAALESHGIQIESPDAWAARRMLKQIRGAQAKW